MRKIYSFLKIFLMAVTVQFAFFQVTYAGVHRYDVINDSDFGIKQIEYTHADGLPSMDVFQTPLKPGEDRWGVNDGSVEGVIETNVQFTNRSSLVNRDVQERDKVFSIIVVKNDRIIVKNIDCTNGLEELKNSIRETIKNLEHPMSQTTQQAVLKYADTATFVSQDGFTMERVAD